MENEYIKKQVSFEVKAINELDDFLRIEAFASTFGNIDRHDDIIDPDAFKDSISQLKKDARDTPLIEGTQFKALLPSLFQHDTDKPIGSIVSLKTNDQGLLVTILLPKEDTRVAGQIMPQLKVRSIKSLSIGGFITKRSFDDETRIRTILRFDLMEISLVTIPANPEAIITSFKSREEIEDLPIAPLHTKWDEQKAITNLESKGIDVDDNNGLSLTLIYSDVIDGEVMVIPRAIFSCAAKLAGRKNPELASKERVQYAIEMLVFYYKKMGRFNPFERGFSPSELNSATPEEMKGIFRNGTRFSKAGAEYIQESIYSSSKRAAKPIPVKEKFNNRLKEIINSHN